jgi:hypothetical protein
MRVAGWPLVWWQQPFFPFFSLSSLIFASNPPNFQCNPLICFSFRLVPFSFWLLFVLFEIIYKIKISFNFILL